MLYKLVFDKLKNGKTWNSLNKRNNQQKINLAVNSIQTVIAW